MTKFLSGCAATWILPFDAPLGPVLVFNLVMLALELIVVILLVLYLEYGHHLINLFHYIFMRIREIG